MSFEVASVSGGGASENGTQTQGVNCQENESAPTVTLATSATSIAENAGSSLTLTATLSVATIADVTVTLATKILLVPKEPIIRMVVVILMISLFLQET